MAMSSIQVRASIAFVYNMSRYTYKYSTAIPYGIYLLIKKTKR